MLYLVLVLVVARDHGLELCYQLLGQAPSFFLKKGLKQLLEPPANAAQSSTNIKMRACDMSGNSKTQLATPSSSSVAPIARMAA